MYFTMMGTRKNLIGLNPRYGELEQTQGNNKKITFQKVVMEML